MIEFEKKTLSNGLRVIVQPDPTSEIAALNLAYDVGARDEDPKRTGFAHLFEHLMFGGSANIPEFDRPLQEVGGENNAFTTNDITNYYMTLPAANLETGFWLESDRMLNLAFSEKSLEVQRQVVIEEFKQRYLNQPYGDLWMLLRPLIYKQHPYRWPTIGQEVRHIEEATMADVKEFFHLHYRPNRAVLSVVGKVEPNHVFELAEKWFGPIPADTHYQRQLAQEPEQKAYRRQEVEREVPVNSFHLAFHMGGRNEENYQTVDLISDLLGRGKSSRLYPLVREKQLFSQVGAFVSGSLDPGVLMVSGKLQAGVAFDDAEKAVWDVLHELSTQGPNDEELEKVINKVESSLVFAEINGLNKAMNLGSFELHGDAGDINHEIEKYRQVSKANIQQQATQVLRRENASSLLYKAL
ncbi:MAG: M16 family metallopeptidase [Salibacteraceae bacterium]